jgi:transposase
MSQVNCNSGESDNTNSGNKRMKISEESKNSLYNMVHGEGLSIKFAAEQLKINYSSAHSIISVLNTEEKMNISENFIEEDKIKKKRGSPSKITYEILRMIDDIVDSNPVITLKDIHKVLSERNNINISKSTVDNALKALKVTLKNSSKILDKVNAGETIEMKSVFSSYFLDNSPRDRRKLIFIDESGFNLHLRRSKARSKKGKRAQVVIPTVRGRNITLLLAANKESIIHFKLISDRTCNGSVFGEFISELFEIISSREDLHGSWVIMDNARIHKIEDVRNTCEQFCCRLQFLSPYSFMLNPVENIFSKIKGFVRDQLSAARNGDRLMDIIRSGILTITRSDLNGYFEYIMENIYKAALKFSF